MYTHKQDLALNNLQGLIGRKTQPTNQFCDLFSCICNALISLYMIFTFV